MNQLRKPISALVLALMCALSIPVYAAPLPTVTVGATVSGSAGTGAPSKGPVIAPGTTLTEALGSGHAIISNVQVSPAQRLHASGKATTSASTQPSAPAVTISVSRPSASASTTAAHNSSNGVLTKEDLQAYVSATMGQEKAIRSASFTDSSVRITYAEPAKLFGIIPVTMTATATTDTKGQVHITYPWYHFMVKARNSSDVETNVAAYTKLMLDHAASTTDSTSFTVRTQARLFDQLSLALEGASQGDAYATTGQ